MFSSGTEPGEIERTTKLMQAFGKVSVGSRRVNAYVTVLATPTYVKGTLQAYNGIGPQFISSSKAAAAPNIERGWEQMQVNTTGNVDVVVSQRRVRDVPRRLLPRSVHRHRYSDNDELDLSDRRRTCGAHRRARRFRRILAAPFSTVNTPRAQITDFDTTKRRTFNADYNHTFQSGGWHTLKGGVRLPAGR